MLALGSGWRWVKSNGHEALVVTRRTGPWFMWRDACDQGSSATSQKARFLLAGAMRSDGLGGWVACEGDSRSHSGDPPWPEPARGNKSRCS